MSGQKPLSMRGLRRLADIVPPDVRSRMMAGIRSKNTKPEMLVRRALHHRGFRYKLHDRSLPGKPDLVFPKYSAAIFVNGCFWHGHDCHLFKMPQSRTEFWREKIETNRKRDVKVRSELERLGFRHRSIWECELRTRDTEKLDAIFDEYAAWLMQRGESEK